jgi:8-oxo-dGTP pyrophosphatase MutT (NUDIX family)
MLLETIIGTEIILEAFLDEDGREMLFEGGSEMFTGKAIRLPEIKQKTAFVKLKTSGGLYILFKRKKDGSWGFPGGKVDSGESSYKAARRETGEEIGANIQLNPRNHKHTRKQKGRETDFKVFQHKVKSFTKRKDDKHIMDLNKDRENKHVSYKLNKKELEEAGYFTRQDILDAIRGKRINIKDKNGEVKYKKVKAKMHYPVAYHFPSSAGKMGN